MLALLGMFDHACISATRVKCRFPPPTQRNNHSLLPSSRIMADAEMKDGASEDTSDSSSDSNTSDTDSEKVETLVAGRQKRTTAANRYDRQRLIEEAEDSLLNDQDEVTLLFADNENEDDEEFEGSEEDERDTVLDSSS